MPEETGINVAGADAYFAEDNHPRSSQWLGFGTDDDDSLRAAAVTNAKRTLSRVLRVDLDADSSLPADPADLTAFPRYDFAVYEQALYDLLNGTIADGSQATPKFIAGTTEPNAVRQRQKGLIAPEALAWVSRGRVMISRG
jgi:hypothetical protein